MGGGCESSGQSSMSRSTPLYPSPASASSFSASKSGKEAASKRGGRWGMGFQISLSSFLLLAFLLLPARSDGNCSAFPPCPISLFVYLLIRVSFEICYWMRWVIMFCDVWCLNIMTRYFSREGRSICSVKSGICKSLDPPLLTSFQVLQIMKLSPLHLISFCSVTTFSAKKNCPFRQAVFLLNVSCCSGQQWSPPCFFVLPHWPGSQI